MDFEENFMDFEENFKWVFWSNKSSKEFISMVKSLDLKINELVMLDGFDETSPFYVLNNTFAIILSLPCKEYPTYKYFSLNDGKINYDLPHYFRKIKKD